MSIQKIFTGAQLGVWTRPFRNLTYASVATYKPEQMQALVKEASHSVVRDNNGNVLFSVTKKLANAVYSFSDAVFSGIKKMFPNKDVKFISIGQSPAVIAEALQIKGMDTAICPISKLAKLKDKDLHEIALSPKFDKYLQYLKNVFGLDLINIDKTKNYIFCDYTSSGMSLKNFKKLLQYKGIKGENLHFKSLKELVVAGTQEADYKKLNFIRRFIFHKLQKCQLKKYCSPIFKLDALHLENAPETLPNNPLFNKLKLLLINISQGTSN